MLAVGVLMTVLLFVFANPLLRLFGAEDEALALSAEYARFIALGAIFQVLATGFVPFIRNMGGSSFAMVAMILGFVTNIALDYTLVWVVNWGMTGAALATVIGQAVTTVAAVLFLIIKKNKLRILAFGEWLILCKEILKVALSPFGLTFSPTVTMLLMNRFLLLYGNERSVAVYGCIGYITSIIYLLLQGVCDGCQPLISYYYGEKNLALVKNTRRSAYITATIITVLCMLGVFFARARVGILFGASTDANAVVIRYIPYFLATLLFLAFVRITTSYFYATEKTALSYILVYAEPIFTLLFLLILPPLCKLTGVWSAVPLAQCATFVIAVIAYRYTERQARSKSE